MQFFVYILFSDTFKRYYIGQTNDVGQRILRHNNGYERATSPYRPWQLIMYLDKPTRGEAMVLEKKLKNLNTEDLKRFIEKYSQ